jgi:hypothetical protein
LRLAAPTNINNEYSAVRGMQDEEKEKKVLLIDCGASSARASESERGLRLSTPAGRSLARGQSGEGDMPMDHEGMEETASQAGVGCLALCASYATRRARTQSQIAPYTAQALSCVLI